MSDKRTTASDFIGQVFGSGSGSSAPVFVCALPNVRGEGPGEKSVVTRDRALIDGFVAKWDRPGTALYFCVGTIRPGAAPSAPGRSVRCKENIAEIVTLQTDTDLKSVDLDRDGIIAALRGLFCPPSVIVWSGRGAHGYWLLNEALDATPETVARIEALNAQLADVVAGDAVQDVCRLMRLPGSHNTKDGGWLDVEIVEARYEPRYSLEDLEEWLSWASPAMRRKDNPRALRTSEAALRNVYEQIAADHGFKIPIDADARLADMSYQGVGDASIHNTQLAVSASLLTRGEPVEDVVELLLAATKAAAGDDGRNWNWAREEKALLGMCRDWKRKYPEIVERVRVAVKAAEGDSANGSLASDARPKAQAKQADRSESISGSSEEIREATSGATVHRLSDERAKREKKDKPRSGAGTEKAPGYNAMVGQAVIEALRESRIEILFTRKAAWLYRDGLWRMEIDGLKAWLDVQIETACRGLGLKSDNKLVSEVRQWVQRDPTLWRDEVAWDAHGRIPTRSGLIDPVTLQVETARPDHFCTWRVEADYDPEATCPFWRMMVSDTFADREPVNREQIVGTLQELLGAALIDVKPRALSKALCLVGGSNYGKSGILEVYGGLFGDEPITAGLESFEGTHGLMPFVRRAPWVLHEAFDQRKWHFSSTVKAIITGEPVSINVKNGPILSARVRAPIFWGTNHPPQFREATRAIVNRMVVIECRREFVEGQYVGVAVEARRRGLDRPSTLVLRDERSGLLNWAIAGLRRALERGSIEVNDEIRGNADEIHRDSNLSAGFIEECIEFDMDRRVSVPDFCAAFSVWFVENKGEDRSIPSNEAVSKAVNALGNRRIASHPKETKDKHRRYFGGVILNELGRAYWKRAFEARTFEGKTASTTSQDGEVNTWIPEGWLDRPTIARMRLAQTGHERWQLELSPENPKTVTSPETVTSTTVTGNLSPELSPTHVSPRQVIDASRKPQF